MDHRYDALRLELRPASSMVRIGGPTGIALPPAAKTITLHRAQNEWCALQVALTCADGTILKGPGGENFNFEIGVASDAAAQLNSNAHPTWYHIWPIHYRGPIENKDFPVPPGNEGWVPDLCGSVLGDKVGNLFLLDTDPIPTTLLIEFPPCETVGTEHQQLKVRRYWFASTSGNTPSPRNPAGEATLDITIVTHPVRLPDRFDFIAATTWNWQIEKFLGRDLTAAEHRRFVDFFLRYRLTPAQFFGKGPGFSEDEIKTIRDRTNSLFQVCHLGGGGARELTDKQKADLKPKLEAWRKQMTDLGVGDRCYALIADEPPPDAAPTIRKNAEWLKSVWPDLKIWAATRPVPELLDVVDVWDVVTAASSDRYAAHSHTAAGLALARGAKTKPQYWWFYSVEPYRPEPNCRLDNDLIDSRSIGWRSFVTGVDGFEYFWATDWSGNPPPEGGQILPVNLDRWNYSLSGAGQLCYPGGSKDDLVPLPSLRLINLRDGMEDWQLFRMAAAKDPHCFDGVTPDLKDPQAIEALRAKAFAVFDVP